MKSRDLGATNTLELRSFEDEYTSSLPRLHASCYRYCYCALQPHTQASGWVACTSPTHRSLRMAWHRVASHRITCTPPHTSSSSSSAQLSSAFISTRASGTQKPAHSSLQSKLLSRHSLPMQTAVGFLQLVLVAPRLLVVFDTVNDPEWRFGRRFLEPHFVAFFQLVL